MFVFVENKFYCTKLMTTHWGNAGEMSLQPRPVDEEKQIGLYIVSLVKLVQIYLKMIQGGLLITT